MKWNRLVDKVRELDKRKPETRKKIERTISEQYPKAKKHVDKFSSKLNERRGR